MKWLIIIVLIFCFVIAFFEVKYFYLKVNSEINKVETRLKEITEMRHQLEIWRDTDFPGIYEKLENINAKIENQNKNIQEIHDKFFPVL